MFELADGKKVNIESEFVSFNICDNGLYTATFNNVKIADTDGLELNATITVPNLKLDDNWLYEFLISGSGTFVQQYPDKGESPIWTIRVQDKKETGNN